MLANERDRAWRRPPRTKSTARFRTDAGKNAVTPWGEPDVGIAAAVVCRDAVSCERHLDRPLPRRRGTSDSRSIGYHDDARTFRPLVCHRLPSPRRLDAQLARSTARLDAALRRGNVGTRPL